MEKSEAMELLREVMEKAGSTAEAAWPLAVRYVWAQALTTICVAAFFFALIPIVFLVARYIDNKIPDDCEGKTVPYIVFGIFTFMVIVISLINVPSAIPTFIEPAGALIRSMIS